MWISRGSSEARSSRETHEAHGAKLVPCTDWSKEAGDVDGRFTFRSFRRRLGREHDASTDVGWKVKIMSRQELRVGKLVTFTSDRVPKTGHFSRVEAFQRFRSSRFEIASKTKTHCIS